VFLNDKDRAALDWNDVRRIRLLAEQADGDAVLDEQRKLREQLDASAETARDLRKRMDWQDRLITNLRAENRDLKARLDAVKRALRPTKKATTPRRARRPKASPT
jgi:regulator of replication initiation timing